MIKPTEENYEQLQASFDYFNDRLFNGKLRQCLITMQRKGRSYGYYRRGAFANRDGVVTDEIALNPAYFPSRTETGVLSTLVHEQTHLWQFQAAKPSRRGYHNRQWANKMIDIGLYPSNTGEPGGRETGYQMTHYIVDGGPFDEACRAFLGSGFQLRWLENATPQQTFPPTTTTAVKGKTDTSNRWKYTCPRCAFNAWAKPQAHLICGMCHVTMPRNSPR